MFRICPAPLPLPALAESNRPCGLNNRSCSDPPSATATRPSVNSMTPRTCRKRYAESALLPITRRGFAVSHNRSLSLQAGRAFSTMRTPALSREDLRIERESEHGRCSRHAYQPVREGSHVHSMLRRGDMLNRQSACTRVAAGRSLMECRPPNALRLSCGAQVERAQTQFYPRGGAPPASGAC